MTKLDTNLSASNQAGTRRPSANLKGAKAKELGAKQPWTCVRVAVGCYCLFSLIYFCHAFSSGALAERFIASSDSKVGFLLGTGHNHLNPQAPTSGDNSDASSLRGTLKSDKGTAWVKKELENLNAKQESGAGSAAPPSSVGKQEGVDSGAEATSLSRAVRTAIASTLNSSSEEVQKSLMPKQDGLDASDVTVAAIKQGIKDAIQEAMASPEFLEGLREAMKEPEPTLSPQTTERLNGFCWWASVVIASISTLLGASFVFGIIVPPACAFSEISFLCSVFYAVLAFADLVVDLTFGVPSCTGSGIGNTCLLALAGAVGTLVTTIGMFALMGEHVCFTWLVSAPICGAAGALSALELALRFGGIAAECDTIEVLSLAFGVLTVLVLSCLAIIWVLLLWKGNN